MVGIVLVNYNGANDTIECLKSLNEISYKDYFVVVVDNNSTDNSKEVLKQYHNQYRYELILPDYNGGFSYGNNIGIKRCIELNADYILLLNNDTVVEKDFLEYILDGFTYSNTVGATIGKIKYEDDRDTIWYAGGSFDRLTARTKHFMYQQKDNNDSKNQVVTFATGCCLCLSREVIDKIGLLDESYFLYEEDADYCLRINDAGYQIVYVPKAVIYHKVGASNTSTNNQYYLVRNKLFLIKKHFKSLNKLIAFLFTYTQSIYRCMKKEYNYNTIKHAFLDFKNNIKGSI